MEMFTDQRSIQFYGGQALARHPARPGDGVCLEPQGFPNSPNTPAFPSAVLRPGQTYINSTRLVFRA
jgi:aldose 1-epimerase